MGSKKSIEAKINRSESNKKTLNYVVPNKVSAVVWETARK